MKWLSSAGEWKRWPRIGRPRRRESPETWSAFYTAGNLLMLAARHRHPDAQQLVRSSHHVTHAGIAFAGRRASACVVAEQAPALGTA